MSFFGEYQFFRRILAVCPCGKLHRVSDLQLKSKAELTEKTWLDQFEFDSGVLSMKERVFAEQEGKIRLAEIEKGRLEAEKAFYRAICPSLKKLKLNPHDIKPILNPIDFIVFKGVSLKPPNVTDILLLSREHQCVMLNRVRKQIKKAVEEEKYDWQEAHIDDVGNIVLK